MRLIDADALLEAFKWLPKMTGWVSPDEVTRLITNAPTVQRERWLSDEAIESAMSSIGMSDNRPLGQQIDSIKTIVS